MHVCEYVQYFILHTKMFHGLWFSSFLVPLYPKNKRAKSGKYRKKFPIITKFPFQVHRHFRYNKNTQIEYTTSKFTIQWTAWSTHTHAYPHTYKYIQTKINTQTHIRLISKEYLSSWGIYKLIKVFLIITLNTVWVLLLRRSFFLLQRLEGGTEIFHFLS